MDTETLTAFEFTCPLCSKGLFRGSFLKAPRPATKWYCPRCKSMVIVNVVEEK